MTSEILGFSSFKPLVVVQGLDSGVCFKMFIDSFVFFGHPDHDYLDDDLWLFSL